MHDEAHVGVDQHAFVVLIGDGTRHFHVGGVGVGVGEGAVAVVVQSFCGVPRIALCILGNGFDGCLLVFGHVEHEAAAGVEVGVARVGGHCLERGGGGAEVGGIVPVVVARLRFEQVALLRHLFHFPRAGSKGEVSPCLSFGRIGACCHHELHLGIGALELQGRFHGHLSAFRTGDGDNGVALAVLGIAGHHEQTATADGGLVHAHDVGFQGFQVGYIVQLFFCHGEGRTGCLSPQVGNAHDGGIVHRLGVESDGTRRVVGVSIGKGKSATFRKEILVNDGSTPVEHEDVGVLYAVLVFLGLLGAGYHLSGFGTELQLHTDGNAFFHPAAVVHKRVVGARCAQERQHRYHAI